MPTKRQKPADAAAEESLEPEPEEEGEVAGGSGGGRRGKSMKKKGTRYRRPTSKRSGTASCSSREESKTSSIKLSPSTSAKKGKRYKKGGSKPTTDEQQRPTSARLACAASSTEAGNHTATDAPSNKKTTISPDVDGGDDVIEGAAVTPKRTWDDLPIKQLKPYLVKYNLAVSGRKATLVERLEKYGTGPEDCVDAPPPGQDSNKKPEDWGSSKAKAFLLKCLMDDKSPVHEMTPKEIYNSHPEFKRYDPERFKANLRELRKAVKKRKKIVEEDEQQFWQQQFTNPRKEFTSKGDPFWDTHKAKTSLEEDFKNGNADKLLPSELRETRLEYQAFSKKVFRGHVYQERRRLREAPFWILKRNKKGLLKHAKEAEALKHEFDTQHFNDDLEEMNKLFEGFGLS